MAVSQSDSHSESGQKVMEMLNSFRVHRLAVMAVVVAAVAFGPLLASSTLLGADVAPIEALPTASIDEFTDVTAEVEVEDISPVWAVLEANGRYYVGGSFTTVGGEPQAHLAAIEISTGRLDPNFRPVVLSTNALPSKRGVTSLAISPDGQDLYVGGFFTKIDDEWRSRVAKLDAITGAVDTAWNPTADAVVDTIETDGTSVWIGGAFQNLGSPAVPAPHLAKLDTTTGALDPAWTTFASNDVLDLDIVGTDLYVAGNFNFIGSNLDAANAPITTDGDNDGDLDFTQALSVSKVARADLQSGTVTPDPADATKADWHPFALHKVYEIDALPDGSLIFLAGAGPKSGGGNSLRAIDPVTGAQVWRRVNAGDYQAIAVTEDAVYAGGHGNYVFKENRFFDLDGDGVYDDPNPDFPANGYVEDPVVNPTNLDRRDKLSAYDPATGDLLAWDPTADSIWGVWAMEVGPSGLLIGGDFTKTGGIFQSHFAVFTADGRGNPAPVPRFTSTCVGNTCAFDASTSTDDGTITGYDWDFGDGQTATGANPTGITLADNSVHQVTVTVTDDDGASAGTTEQVMVGTLSLPTPLVGSDAVSYSTTTAFTATVPPEAEANDVVFAFLSLADVAATVTPPDGWTLLEDQQSVSLRSRIYWRVVRPSDVGTAATFTSDIAAKGDVMMAAFRGVDTANPVLASAGALEDENRGSHHAPALSYTGDATVLHYWADRNAVTSRFTAPGDEITLQSSIGTGSGKVAAVMSLEPTAQTDGSPEAVAVADEATKNAYSYSVALRPFAAPDLNPAAGTVERVIHVSIDGLGSGWVDNNLTPNVMNLIAEGTSTLNARADGDSTQTLPNHVSQVTGRPVLGADGHGVDFNQWDDRVDTNTIHDEAGEYVASVFDVVHDNGLKTAGFVSKRKLVIMDLTWSDNGAPDVTGADNGTDKIDVWLRDDPASVTAAAIGELIADPPEYTFLHLRSPDEIGHANQWGSPEYEAAVQESDALLGDVLDAIANNAELAGTTAVIVTSDHGGVTGLDAHIDPLLAGNYTIPFVYWGPTVGEAVDMYADEAGVRTDPGGAHSPENGVGPTEPIRDHDAANLALKLLGLPAISGSVYNLGAAVPDLVAPTVTFDSPVTLPAGVHSLSGTAIDDDSSVAKVRILVRETATGLYWTDAGWSPQWSWTTADLNGTAWTLPDVSLSNNGTYKVLLWAWDANDNLAAHTENPQPTLTIGSPDLVAPTVTFDSPVTLPAGVHSLSGTAIDDDSSVAKVRILVRETATGLYWTDAGWSPQWSWTTADLNGTAWTLPDVSLSNNGTYKVLLWAWDANDNLAAHTENPQPTLTIGSPDLVAPTVTFDSPVTLPAGVHSLSGTAIDDDSSVAKVRILVRETATGLYWTDAGWSPQWSWTTADLNGTAWTLPDVSLSNNGTYKVLLWAWDANDNLAAHTENPQPTLTIG